MSRCVINSTSLLHWAQGDIFLARYGAFAEVTGRYEVICRESDGALPSTHVPIRDADVIEFVAFGG